MKKLVYLLLLTMIISVASCVNRNEKAESEKERTVQENEEDTTDEDEDSSTGNETRYFSEFLESPTRENTAISLPDEKKQDDEKNKKDEKKGKAKKIGGFTTKILNRDEDRVNNIEIAVKVLNGISVKPGEEFSFNDTLGRRTRSKGYESAPIFVREPDGDVKRKEGVGGGICQVSSTLYNAVLDAGLKVTERHAHSKEVDYVPEGKDASVVYGSRDFKFVNNRDETVYIRASTDGKKVYISLYTGGLPGE